jgi:murein DD-endopeptidase MepM/ murein hydrolase activator NlpD
MAVAAGAAVSAGHAGANAAGLPNVSLEDISAKSTPQTALPADHIANSTIASTDTAPLVLPAASSHATDDTDSLIAKGEWFIEQEIRKHRPDFVLPCVGTFTSGFGIRWGAFHAGIDLAAPIGTPIFAVADGTIIESGPAAGFGMWVRVQHGDGTITTYGHIDTTLVQEGQKVLAGDQIATVGNRGFSTGPHLHLEVALHGTQKVDPHAWLADRGIQIGPYVG